MKVLVLTADLPPDVHSGVGTAVAYSTQALVAAGCTVDVLTTAANARVEGVGVTQLETRGYPDHLRRHTVVHLHSLRLADLAFQLKKREGSALVYTAHALLEQELRDTPASQRWQGKQAELFEQADHVIFLNDAERSAALRQHPSLARRSAVLPNAIAAASPVMRKPERSPLVLFAGRFCYSKGVEVAVAAMDTLLNGRPEVRCAFVGGNGDTHGEALVAGLAERHAGRCFAPGWLPQRNVQAWLERASLLLMPSRYEPFGMVALEAMRVGLPVLGAGIESLRELLAADSGGTTLQGHDPEDWAEAVSHLLNDSQRLQRMSALGPGYVQAHYGLQNHGKRYLAVLRRCCELCATGGAAREAARQGSPGLPRAAPCG